MRSNVIPIDDPESPGWRLLGQRTQESIEQSENFVRPSGGRSKHHDSGMFPGRVGADVGEIEIESNEDPLLGAHEVRDDGVGRSGRYLVEN